MVRSLFVGRSLFCLRLHMNPLRHGVDRSRVISDLRDLEITELFGMGGDCVDEIEADERFAFEGEAFEEDEEEEQTTAKKKAADRGEGVWREACVICGDRASGFHYNAFSCEGCKGFFRRSVTRNANYSCRFGGSCEMDMWMRRKCQACRLRRCREVGMKEEFLLPESQCRERDARRKARRCLHSKKKKTAASPPSDAQVSPKSDVAADTVCENPLELLRREERSVVEKLVAYQDQYEVPTEEAVSSLSLSTNLRLTEDAKTTDLSVAVFRHMAEMTILVTHLVVEFAKHLPGFVSLQREDQIVLLKGSASEVMMLRTARRYDPASDAVIFADGTAFDCDALRTGGLQYLVDDMFNFSRRMSRLEVDNAEYALLTAISIFSDRPGLADSELVEKHQETYVNTLREYIKVRRKQKKNYLAKLLLKLVDLRSLGSNHFKVLKDLNISRGSLPPLLSEYFDIF